MDYCFESTTIATNVTLKVTNDINSEKEERISSSYLPPRTEAMITRALNIFLDLITSCLRVS